MKKYLGFVIVIALMSIMTACTQKTNVQQHVVSSATNQKTLSLVGSINNKFGIHMQLDIKDKNISGTYYYDNIKTNLQLKGNIDDKQHLTMNEYDSKGTVTGVFKGQFVSSNKIQGTWTKPDGTSKMPFVVSEQTLTTDLSNKSDNTSIQQQNDKKNSNEYIGHWYTSLPDTGGNSTTIEITKMSNTSVSFRLYYCRTYSYDGTNIKLENNIARFVDNDDDYNTSGTIEFRKKSIIVNVEKTNLPILDAGKTVFNYKVNEFNAVSTTPSNGATDVMLDKGIVIDFGRNITNTTNDVGALLTKPNVPEGPDDGSIILDGEIEGNKLILSPSSLFGKSKIEAGQMYDLVISEGELRDETGNINNKINLQFTTEK